MAPCGRVYGAQTRDVARVGVTGISVPVKPLVRRLCRISEPMRPRSALAPMTAMQRGSKKGRSDAAAAICARRPLAFSNWAVGSRSSATWNIPCSSFCVSVKPDCRNTSIMTRLSPST